MHNPDILLINPPFHMRAGSGNFLPLGLGYIVSAVNNSGFTAEIINCAELWHTFFDDELASFEVWLTTELQKYAPKLVGIGPCITSQIRALKIISNVCKNVLPNTPIVCGGPLATMHDQEWVFFEELNIPYIIKGDGEEAIPLVIKTIDEELPLSSCSAVSYQGHTVLNEISDINTIVFPYRTSANAVVISNRRKCIEANKVTMPMITSRGCVYSCDYCVSGSMDLNFRKRSKENIVDEMIYLRDNFGVTDVIFYDDCFFNNSKSLSKDIEDFCNLLFQREVGLSWQIELRTDILIALSDESIKLLEQAGCRQINIGIEKMNNEALTALGKTSSVTGLKEKNKHITDISAIQITATFILGGIDEDEGSVRQLITASKEMSLSQAHFNPLFVYPATRLYTKCGYQNRDWCDIILKDTLPWGEIVCENEQLSRDKLLILLDIAYNEFYGGSCQTYANSYSNRFNLRR